MTKSSVMTNSSCWNNWGNSSIEYELVFLLLGVIMVQWLGMRMYLFLVNVC